MADFSWEPIVPKGNYIDGAFTLPASPEGALRDVNPGNTDDVIAEFPYAVGSIDQAVAAAKRAFSPWRDLPFSARAELLGKYKEALERNKERLAQAISREMGKVLWEARGEVTAMANKVPITVEDGMRLVDDLVPAGVKGRVRYLPRGVMAVIGPFNFPGHLPNGHIVPALATGNTVVFKPASHTPGVAQIMAECFHQAGFPPGVFNLVQVPGRHGDRLVGHEDVDGVLFTGSTEVGMHIEEVCMTQSWKITALEMGGKNAAIVLDDAPLEQSLYEVLTGAFLTSGQRCTATSRIILQRGIADRFVERLAAAVTKLGVGAQYDESAFMGSLVDQRAADDFDRWQGTAKEEGAHELVRGGRMDPPQGIKAGAYVRPSLHRVDRVDPKSRYQNEELFAPDTCIYTVDTLEEAIGLADRTEYGLACSIFTADEKSYLEVVKGVTAGVINWNRSTVGASSKLPFGGMKKSGNGHPAALFSTLYCTYPVASLEDDKPFDPDNLLPGVHL
jgi:succinylglutamic semialdehyde dehydrogenase